MTYDAAWAAACWRARGDADARRRAEAILKAAQACHDPQCTHGGSDCLRWKEIREDQQRRRRHSPGAPSHD